MVMLIRTIGTSVHYFPRTRPTIHRLRRCSRQFHALMHSAGSFEPKRRLPDGRSPSPAADLTSIVAALSLAQQL